MKKTLVVTLVTFVSVFISTAVMAKSQICEITAIEGEQLTLQCDQVEGLSTGDTVKLKTKSKKTTSAVEGC
ncbi:selenite/tellurite reduction operon protein ExtJ [Desulfogranum japonicum]|uniref:selenite/tellurite reduction operon protein ExtJ n=1 Tax=Desulfogranum japonicum TaxID=231447 RepID=UPI00040DC8A5|nr:hypothetical protein [Desulfogranum japonicum]